MRSPIVLVDDDEAVRAALAFSLEIEGYRVFAFANAEEALDAALNGPHAYIIDHRLPGADGLALLARLRAAGARGPAVLITTNPNSSTRARALAAGVEIVEKPLMGDDLILALRRASPV